MIKKIQLLSIVGVLILTSSSWSFADTLQSVKDRGELKCGVNTALVGFATPNSRGKWVGIDVDICRAVATAIFNDPSKVDFTALSAQQRFTAIQSGEVDILSRNTTKTLQREVALGLLFAPVVYYDGQGFLVKKNGGIREALKLHRRTVCVQPGTTTELNLADFSRNNRINIKSVVIEKFEESVSAYMSGRCDSLTTDVSALASVRSTAKNPNDHIILPQLISKEPLAPAVRQGDDKWFNIVSWTVLGLIAAEEYGVTSSNVSSLMKSSDNQNIKRLLNSEVAKSFDLSADFMANVIKELGNYGEIFERNIGKETPLKLERGLNALWTDGGLQYAPPFR